MLTLSYVFEIDLPMCPEVGGTSFPDATQTETSSVTFCWMIMNRGMHNYTWHFYISF
jgi:hypothetical protein